MDYLNNHSSVVHGRRNIMWRRKIMKILISLFLLAMWSSTVTPQGTGEFCILKNGGVGVCQPLARCLTAVHKAVQGDRPVVCSIYMNDPIVCCEENVYFKPLTNNYEFPQNVIPKIARQQLPRLSHEYYVFEGAPVSMDYPVRFSRGDGNKPWWLTSHPFSPNEHPPAPVQVPSTSNRPSTENTNHHWWVIDKPFSFQPSKPDPAPVSAPAPAPAPAPVQKPQTPTRPERPVTRPNTEGLRLSEIKCREYSKLVTSQVSALPLVPVPDPVQHEVPKCEFNSVQLIVGGKEAEAKEFPHMAAIGYEEDGEIEWRCGGSLISDYYVLTAAHCSRRSIAMARLGELNLKSSNDGAKPVNYMIDKVIKHPEYKFPDKYHDIALLKLERRVEFSEFIRPACIYTRNNFDVNKVIATGWGKVGSYEESSDVLRKVGLNILDNKVCDDVYAGELGLPNGIADTMMCVGELAGGNDTCQGDSGGPIQITKPNNQCIFNVVGITSFGILCAQKNTPGVYTRVSSYVPWIESIVWA